MFQTKPLHLYHLIVAGSVVEWVTSLREIVQHISRVKNWHQAAVHPGNAKKVIWNLKVHMLQILRVKFEVSQARINHI